MLGRICPANVMESFRAIWGSQAPSRKHVMETMGTAAATRRLLEAGPRSKFKARVHWKMPLEKWSVLDIDKELAQRRLTGRSGQSRET